MDAWQVQSLGPRNRVGGLHLFRVNKCRSYPLLVTKRPIPSEDSSRI